MATQPIKGVTALLDLCAPFFCDRVWPMTVINDRLSFMLSWQISIEASGRAWKNMEKPSLFVCVCVSKLFTEFAGSIFIQNMIDWLNIVFRKKVLKKPKSSYLNVWLICMSSDWDIFYLYFLLFSSSSNGLEIEEIDGKWICLKIVLFTAITLFYINSPLLHLFNAK